MVAKQATAENLRIRDVWADNLDEEFAIIREIVETHPFLAMDTEFPGVVARPLGSFKNSGEYQYQTLRCNVDLLKLIQLGLTFSDAEGNLPLMGEEYCVWQFNFKEFNLSDDMFAQDSIDLLKESGIDFQEMCDRGIDTVRFGELLISSGIVLNDEIQFLTFHSGYDFGYLMKLVTCQALPTSETEFFELLKIYFPCIYDMKYLMKQQGSLHGGLNKLAEQLEVKRIGPQHQAGSDSLLTSSTFFELVNVYFGSGSKCGEVKKHVDILYGLGVDGDGDVNRAIC